MQLKDLCSRAEATFGLEIQIVPEEKHGIFGAWLNKKHLEVTGPEISTKTISGSTNEDLHLSWWLIGFIQGVGMVVDDLYLAEELDEYRPTSQGA
jgi:hypothetical protein